MDGSRWMAKKYRGQGSRRRFASKCAIVAFVILAMTWFCPSPGALHLSEPSLEPSQDMSEVDVGEVDVGEVDVRDACYGRRVHMYDMPEVFNIKLLEYCDGRMVSWIRFCKHYQNYGFGEVVNVTGDMFRDDWYRTDAYMLEVMFYERMRTYACLTDTPANADIFFVPFFAGLDALPYLYDETKKMDKQGYEVISWLRGNAAEWWGRYGGQDHFIIAGRTAWDFQSPNLNEWGTYLFDLDEMRNVTFMVLERVPWRLTEQAIPYPVGFHPSSDASLDSWIKRVRRSNRTALFSFSGALRPQRSDSIRGILSDQCVNASTECSRLDCAQISCSHNPEPIYESLLQAVFCLQPRGDTATRRSTIDSIVSGCIPVFFHEDTAQTQYLWHFPQDYESFSVFIPEDCIKNGTCIVRDILKKIPAAEVFRLREKLISMIPSVVYRHPLAVNFSQSDAFDMTIEGMSRKVASLKYPLENVTSATESSSH
ncbi:hypothetical protein M758_4G062700 [Ceratodon purpureus]|nr:hypothetical protein M758_4G062700 [Ceratodon purpureus]